MFKWPTLGASKGNMRLSTGHWIATGHKVLYRFLYGVIGFVRLYRDFMWFFLLGVIGLYTFLYGFYDL